MKHKILFRPKVKSRPYKEVMDLMNKVETKEEDYFGDRSFCYLGLVNPHEYYEDFDKFPDFSYYSQDVVGWEIDPTIHLNLDIIASAGMGKGKISKNIIAQYHKAGWRILVISPKDDEYSAATRTGNNFRLHPHNKPERLPIVSYCPAYVKHWREKNKYSNRKYKFYSPSIKDFSDNSVWRSFDLSSLMANYCAGKVLKGISSLRDLFIEVAKDGDRLFSGQAKSLRNIIENMLDNKFIDESLPQLDLLTEWGFNKEDKGRKTRENNVVVVNFFSHSAGSFMPNSIWMVLNQLRETVQKARAYGFKERVLVVLDDMYYYSAKSNQTHHNCISSIINIKTNLRKLGVDNICQYQFLDLVDSSIYRSTKNFLLSYIPDKKPFSAILPKECIWYYEDELESKQPYHVEWIYFWNNKEWQAFYPENVKVGHDFD